MPLSTEHLRYILGLKLRRMRQKQGLALKELAERTRLSISYLSEIEKGKKYPKPDKLLRLARALQVGYDELVSQRVDPALGPVKEALSSDFLQQFPLELFGVEPERLVALLAEDPVKAGALIRTFLEVGRTYDVRVEQFLTAALRSYQVMHANYFPELERQAAAYRQAEDWPPGEPVAAAALAQILERRWGYELDEETLAGHPELGDFRSVLVDGEVPRLLVNPALLPSQKAFVLAREIGYRQLGLQARPPISTWLEMESFEQVLNNFKASYFAGALLIDAESLGEGLTRLFGSEAWDGDAFLALAERFDATPEMFFYRLTELVPRRFGLSEIFFLRFHHDAGSTGVELTKLFNMSRVPVPHGLGGGEHYCRRWPALQLLSRLAEGSGPPASRQLAVQRSHFLEEDAEFFVVARARPLVLKPRRLSCVALGFLVNRTFRRRVRFWDDPAIPRVVVNLTCERCRLTAAECAERVAEPSVVRARERLARQKAALAELMAQSGA